MEILIVEDDDAICELLSGILEAAGYAVTVAKDGLEALERIKQRQPAAVLLDISMPRMDGISVLQRLKADPATQDLPVLMLTAQSSPDDIRRAIQFGARDYLGKPFEPRQLLRRVARIVNG